MKNRKPMPVSVRATIKKTGASCSNSGIFSFVIFSFQFSWGRRTRHPIWLLLRLCFPPAKLLVTLNVSGSCVRQKVGNVRRMLMMTMIKLHGVFEGKVGEFSMDVLKRLFYSQEPVLSSEQTMDFGIETTWI